MLGSTAAGASAAGTVGIIGGTAGALGTLGAILMAPATIIAAIGTGVAVAGLEGACWIADDRITDPAEVAAILRSMSAHADPAYFQFLEWPAAPEPVLRIGSGNWRYERYLLGDLYIVNGVLMHRDWGRNTTIGRVRFRPAAAEAD